VLLRGGPALWREVLDKRRLEEGVRPADDVLAGWKQKATQVIDDGLATIPAGAKPDKTTVAAVISRCQIAIEDGNNDLVMQLLEQPDYGPWTVVNGQDPVFTEGSLAENTLSLALRYFIQTEKLDKAQQAMDRLEAVAGTGEEASAKLTAMYLAMGRDLQAQLDELGSGDKASTPEAQSKAKAILGGFEKFLDGVGKRDQKISSQMWVATTYLSLGSGAGTGSVVPKNQAEGYLAKAAEVYEKLLKQGGDQIAKFEPSIRLKMANVYRELGKWDDAQGHIDWLLSDAKRQNSLDTQIQAAELLQTAGEKAGDKAKAEQYFKQAIVGRTVAGEPRELHGVVFPSGGAEAFTIGVPPGSGLVLRKQFLLDATGQLAEVVVNGSPVGNWDLRRSEKELSGGLRESIFVIDAAALGGRPEADVEIRYSTPANTATWTAFAWRGEDFPLSTVGAVHAAGHRRGAHEPPRQPGHRV
jgi:tetratricopeptide (TPR) repeat protein